MELTKEEIVQEIARFKKRKKRGIFSLCFIFIIGIFWFFVSLGFWLVNTITSFSETSPSLSFLAPIVMAQGSEGSLLQPQNPYLDTTNDTTLVSTQPDSLLNVTKRVVNWLLGIAALLWLIVGIPLGIYLIASSNKKISALEKYLATNSEPIATTSESTAILGKGYVGFWWRLIAYMIDILLSRFVVPLLFQLYFYFAHGQTIGYKVIGAKIYNYELGNVSKARTGQLIGRFFAKIFSASALRLGFFAVIRDKKKQGRHDSLASTVVIQEKKPIIWLAVILSLLSIGGLLLYFFKIYSISLR